MNTQTDMSVHASQLEAPGAPGCLQGPWADMLLLGGASVVTFVLLSVITLTSSQLVALGVAMMILANFINHPHFAHSYQIFYGTWQDVKSGAMPLFLRIRWYLAGFVLPSVLVAWLIFAGFRWTEGEGLWIAMSLNILGALVGWHYVKQGFGMAMMDAALKKKYWTPEARKVLLWNAYACWFAAWVLINVSKAGSSFWGFFGIGVDIPGWVVFGVCVVAGSTTVWATLTTTRHLSRWPLGRHHWSELPVGGITAYFVTLYLWTVFAWINPAYALMIPFFHSLQYLTVVWRYKKNELESTEGAGNRGLIKFWIVGVALGALGFWAIPIAIDFLDTGYLPYVSAMSQPALAIATFWIFINIHHYLIDNVLWRQGNPKVNRYLFQGKQT